MKSISVIMPTYNSLRTIEAALKSLREQNYDQQKIEILVVDGGSTDRTRQIILQYKGKIISDNSVSPESARAVALKQAKGDLILIMDSDNVLPKKNWLRIMVNCLLKEPRAVAAYPWRYAYRKTDSSLNRYFALTGVNDPVARWLGRADRQGYESDKWQLSGKALDKGEYFLAQFTVDNMPTLGANGVLVWRKKLLKAQVDEQHYFHIDVFWDLINLGMNQFVVVKNLIIHDTGERFYPFIKKRLKYAEELYFKQQKLRRFKWGKTGKDKFKLGGYVIYSLTIMGPLIDSIRGYLKKPDWAWFWQIIMAPSLAITYGLMIIIRLIK